MTWRKTMWRLGEAKRRRYTPRKRTCRGKRIRGRMIGLRTKAADTGTGADAVFDLPRPEPPPDFSDEVERQLRIADTAKWAEVMWAEILKDYQPYARTLVFVPRPRR